MSFKQKSDVMNVTAVINGTPLEVGLKLGATITDLLKTLNLTSVVITINGKHLTDEELHDGDIVSWLQAFRGGVALPPRDRPLALECLRTFSDGAEELIIVDPYAYSMSTSTHEFLEAVGVASPLSSLRRLLIVYDHTNNANATPEHIRRNLAQHSVTMLDEHCNEIHDRIWIADENRGLLVGTSFNSVGGRRLAFAVQMPSDDVAFLLKFLDERNLLTRFRSARTPVKSIVRFTDD